MNYSWIQIDQIWTQYASLEGRNQESNQALIIIPGRDGLLYSN